MDARSARTRHAVLDAGLGILISAGLDSITHTRIATASGVARRTLYRHWPNRMSLLRDILAGASFPTYVLTGDSRSDVRAHLVQLRDALVHGPLAYIVMALSERSAVDPSFAQLRDDLVAGGSEPLRAILLKAAPETGAREIQRRIADLEGPLFYEVCVRGGAPSDDHIDALVDQYLPMCWQGTR